MTIKKLIDKFFVEPIHGIITVLLFLFFSSLSPKFSSWLGGKLAKIISPIFPQNKIAMQNLKLIFPELALDERKKILDEAIENLGKSAGEYPHLGKLNKYIEVTGINNLPKNKPIIFVASHLANWELTPYPGVILNKPVMRIYRKLNAPLSEWILRKRPSPLPGDVVPKGRIGAIKMMSTIKSGGLILILSDQRLNTGIKIKFLGHQANTLVSPALMAIKFNCQIHPLQIIRKQGCRFKIIIHKKIIVPSKKFPNKQRIKLIMENINDIISSWVIENPGQWFWHHRRWKN